MWLDQLIALAAGAGGGSGADVVPQRRPDDASQRPPTRRDATDWQRVRAVVPLVIGSYAAYAGAALWWDYRSLDVMRQLDPAMAAAAQDIPLTFRGQFYVFSCWGAVSPRYFDQMSYVIPLLLITLGIEAGFFRRRRSIRSSGWPPG